MPGFLVYGKGFRREPALSLSGETFEEVKGVDGGFESISWSSVSEMTALGALHDVPESMWPIYDCEIEAEIPLADACTRSRALHHKLASIWTDELANDPWFSFIMKLLWQGHSFFIMP